MTTSMRHEPLLAKMAARREAGYRALGLRSDPC